MTSHRVKISMTLVAAVATACGSQAEKRHIATDADSATSPAVAPEEATEGFNIYNGTADAAGNDPSIFMISGINSSGQVTAPIGTATNIRYPRCLLTAGHVATPPSGSSLVAWQGQVINPATSKAQSVAQKVIKGTGNFDDLAILWLENRVGPSSISSYTQKPMKDDIGLQHVDFVVPGDLADQSIGGPVEVTYYGYGANTLAATGSGTRRKGSGKARWYSIGNMELPALDGSAYQLQPMTPAGAPGAQRACEGDSGGPVIHDGKVFAVLKGASTGSCDATGTTVAVGLDDEAAPGGQSNKDWIHEWTRRICRKSIDVRKSGPGKVTGILTADPSDLFPDPSIDGLIQCAWDTAGGSTPSGWLNCGESVHDGESITLTATPDSGKTFYRWMSSGAACPCALSTNPVCTMSYASLGTYSFGMSLDGSFCVAVFNP
jgi:hypothetical protein